jgi:hypothetical protein
MFISAKFYIVPMEKQELRWRVQTEDSTDAIQQATVEMMRRNIPDIEEVDTPPYVQKGMDSAIVFADPAILVPAYHLTKAVSSAVVYGKAMEVRWGTGPYVEFNINFNIAVNILSENKFASENEILNSRAGEPQHSIPAFISEDEEEAINQLSERFDRK